MIFQKTAITWLYAFLLFPLLAIAHPGESPAEAPSAKKIYHTKMIQQTVPVIDGSIDDPIWSTVSWGGDFTQVQPKENESHTQKTNFKIH